MQRDIAKNCFSNSCRAKRWFCSFFGDFQILLSLMIDLHAFRKLEVPEARYSSFLKGTLRSSLLMSRISETLSNVTQRIVAKASRPKMDDTLLNRDISDNPSGMYSSETLQNKKSLENSAFCSNCFSIFDGRIIYLVGCKIAISFVT